MNFLSLVGKGYENTARGILYVIYEVVWKLTYYVLSLIDEITKLFYKVAGINVNDGVVEKSSIIDQILGQNVITTAYVILLIFALGLILVFSLVMVIRSITREEHKSLGPLFKNMALAFLLLAVMGPVVLFAISAVSNIAVWIAGLGSDNNISISDVIFSNSGNLIEVYNTVFETTVTSFRELGNGFLYDLMYLDYATLPEGTTQLAYHWYISLLGGAFVLYNLGYIVFEMVKRLFNIVILYVASPFTISKMVLDDGKSFREWQSKLIYEFILLLAQISTFMIFVALVNVINSIDLDSLASGSVTPEDTGGLGDIYEPLPGETPDTETVTTNFSLLNGVGRTLIIMAAVSVTRSSATMLAQLLKGKETKTDALLENVLTKISSRASQPATRTRTITRNTTTTKRETVFVESQGPGSNQGAFSSGGGSNIGGGNKSSGTTTNHITQNVTISNKFNSTNTINNRTAREGIAKGSYSGEKIAPANVYINTTRTPEITPNTTNEWKMMDKTATNMANNMINDYKSASNNFSAAISSNDSSKIQQSFTDYAAAYKKEAEILADNYRKFEQKATVSMTSEISKQTKEELKNISNSYRKAQMDYAKTASKLQQMNGERISTSDALKMKEQADKQRERLMSASNKAAHFYENQKKGE